MRADGMGNGGLEVGEERLDKEGGHAGDEGEDSSGMF